ncbi:hypothetical protein [Paenibacillus amylolyticus]|uniref:hypothetical protein n=1 Tax=Paenibacillus amylolyticus TaxID=1451 RepID=UPI003394AF74
MFAREGAIIEVTVLANAESSVYETGYDKWNGGTYTFTLYLIVSIPLYAQIENEIEAIQNSICNKLNKVVGEESHYYNDVRISIRLSEDAKWRENAKSWLGGSYINNQGRVRSDNIASRISDGLLFRSLPEIHFYKALKSLGVSFAPLPVFVKVDKHISELNQIFLSSKMVSCLLLKLMGILFILKHPQKRMIELLCFFMREYILKELNQVNAILMRRHWEVQKELFLLLRGIRHLANQQRAYGL